MAGASFRMFFGSTAATVEQLRRVEEITVEQEIDMAWEARVRLSLCLGADGKWIDPPSVLTSPYQRMRIETKLKNGNFTPLIDGTVVGFDTSLSANPGTSTVEIVVRDDTVLMNREEAYEVFHNRDDRELAQEIFGRFPFIGSTQLGVTGVTGPNAVRRGTPIQFLRELGRVHNFKAYVLPGDDPGSSTGVFDKLPTRADGLPPLVLMGSKRSMQSATFREDSNDAENTVGRSLTISNQQIVSAQRSFQDQELMGEVPALAQDAGAVRTLPPQNNTNDTPDAATDGQANRSSYSYTMTGALLPGCYDAVLRPYRVVNVKAGDIPESGAWLLHKVTHKITPSVYTQDIQAKRNARSDLGGGFSLPGVF